MRVILLGTGGSAGVPLIGGADGSGDWGACDPAEPRNRRTRTSIVVESDSGMRLLVDTSPDCESSCWPVGCRGWMPFSTPMRMPTTSPASTTCGS